MLLKSRAGLCAGELHDVCHSWRAAAFGTHTEVGEITHLIASHNSREVIRHCGEAGPTSVWACFGGQSMLFEIGCACMPRGEMGKQGWSCAQASLLQQL